MRKIIFLSIITLTILAAGCTAAPPGPGATVSPVPQPTKDVTASWIASAIPTSPPPTNVTPGNGSYHFSGHGLQSTDRFYLNTGLATFNTTNTHDDSQNTYFQAYLIDSNGTVIDTIADSNIETNIKRNTVIRTPGEYYINTNTRNGWEIIITQ